VHVRARIQGAFGELYIYSEMKNNATSVIPSRLLRHIIFGE